MLVLCDFVCVNCGVGWSVCGCVLVVGYLEGCVCGEGGIFCIFLLVKLMGAVVSRYGLWNDVKLSVIGQSQ